MPDPGVLDESRLLRYLHLLGWVGSPLGAPAGRDALTSAEVRAILVADLLDSSDSREEAARRAPLMLSGVRGAERSAAVVHAVQRVGLRRDPELRRGPRYAALGDASPVVVAQLEEPALLWRTGRDEVLLGLRGDYLVHRRGDERPWTVMPEIFARRYRRRSDGSYRRVGVVRAIRHDADEAREILSPEGPQHAERGDWVLTSEAGDWWVQSGRRFPSTYAELDV